MRLGTAWRCGPSHSSPVRPCCSIGHQVLDVCCIALAWLARMLHTASSYIPRQLCCGDAVLTGALQLASSNAGSRLGEESSCSSLSPQVPGCFETLPCPSACSLRATPGNVRGGMEVLGYAAAAAQRGRISPNHGHMRRHIPKESEPGHVQPAWLCTERSACRGSVAAGGAKAGPHTHGRHRGGAPGQRPGSADRLPTLLRQGLQGLSLFVYQHLHCSSVLWQGLQGVQVWQHPEQR